LKKSASAVEAEVQQLHRQLDESEMVKFFMQLKILLIKNATIFFRKKKILFFMFATPFLVAFMLHYIDSLAVGMNEQGIVDQKKHFYNDGVKKCYPKETKSYEEVPECTTVGYSILGDHTEA